MSPVITIVVVAIVAAAMFTQNLRSRGPYVTRRDDPGHVWEVRTTFRGWPLSYYENSIAVLMWARMPYVDAWPAPVITVKSPQLNYRNPQTLYLAGNIILGLLMLAATAIVCEYWRRHRSGPFQFGLRSLLVATAIVAAIVALLDNGLMHWSALLSPALAVGIVALPTVMGLVLDVLMRRSERRCSQLRSRFESAER